MAKQLNVNLAFTADTSQASAQVQNLQRQLTQLINNPVGIGEKITKEIQEATLAAADLKAHLQNATNVNTGTLDFSKLSQSLKQSGISLSEYAGKLQAIGPQGQQAFMSLARSVANAEVPLKRSNALLQQFGTTLANTARWQLSSSLLHGFIGAVSTAWNYSQDLNESLNNIRIVTGYNIDQMSKFADQANKAAKALSTTTTDYTNASLIYYQQGLSDSEVLSRTETTIKMANASRQSAEIVSDQMTAIWNNFYDGSKSLEYYADVVTALGAATASSSGEISQGLEKFAAVADTVGLSYEYATAALATVTATTRQSADVVGTAFKTLFARLSDLKLGETLDDGTTLGSYSANLAKIGVNIKDASGQLKDMDTILNETAAKWENLDKAQQVALAKGVAGIRQYTQFIALMDNWDFMEENLSTVKNSSGELQKQADIYAESWEAASKRVQTSLETIYSSVMDDEFFISLTNGFADLIDGVGGFIKSIGGLQGVLSGLGFILTKVFADQMAHGFERLAYNIQMSTEAGRKAIQTQKLNEMQGFADQMSKNSMSPVSSKVYKQELLMQQELIEKADQMTAMDKTRAQVLIEQHRALGEQTIELERQLELTKEKIANSATEIIGTGLNNGKTMDTALRDIQFTKLRAQAMGEVDIALKKVSTSGKITEKGIDAIGNALAKAGVKKHDIQDLGNRLRKASGDAGAMEEAIVAVNARLTQTTSKTAEAVAALLGVKKGTPEFKALSDEIARYMQNTRTATTQQENLDTALSNCKKSGKTFSQVMKEIGDQTKSTAQLMSTVVSSLMSAGMLISSIQGLVDTLEDPDASGWEKFGRILTSVSMIAMSFSGVLSGLKAAQELVSSGALKNTIITTANTLAQYLNEKSQKMNTGTKGAATVVNGAYSKSLDKNTKDSVEQAAATHLEEEALEDLNEEKAKSIILDKASGGKSDLTSGTFKSGNRAGQAWYKQGNKFISADKFTAAGGSTATGAGTGAAGAGAGAAGAGTGAAGAGAGAGGLGGALSGLLAAMGPLLVIAGAVALIAGTIWAVSEAYNKEAKEAENAAKSAELLNQIHEETKQRYEDLKNTISDYDSAVEGLDKLTEGTVEFEEAITNANEKAMELIGNYSELQGKYSVDNNGLIKFDEGALEDVQKKESEKVRKTASASQFMQRRADEKQREADILDFKRKKLRTNEDAEGVVLGGLGGAAAGAVAGAMMGSIIPIIGPAIGALVGAIGGAIGIGVAGTSTDEEDEAMEKIYSLYKEQGNAIFAKGTFEKLLRQQGIESDLIEDLVKNTDEIKKYVSERKAGEDADKAAWISDYLRNNPEVAEHANAEAIAAQAYENSKNNKDTTVDDLGNADLMKAYVEEVLGESAEKQGWGTGSAWVSENYKIADTGGDGYSFYVKGEDGKWVLQGDENAYSIDDAREALRNERTQKAAGNNSKNQIAETEKVVAEYKALGVKNDELINKLISASTDGNNASLTLDEYLSLQSKDLSKLSKEQKKTVDASLKAYEKNKPDFFKNKEFQEWYNSLNEFEKNEYEAKISLNVDEDTTLDSIQAAVENAQNWLNHNQLITSIGVREELDSFLNSNERYNLTPDEDGKTGEDKFFELLLNSGIVSSSHYTVDSAGKKQFTEEGKNYYRNMTTPEIKRLIEDKDKQVGQEYLDSSEAVVASSENVIETEKDNIANGKSTIKELENDIVEIGDKAYKGLFQSNRYVNADSKGSTGQRRLASLNTQAEQYSTESLEDFIYYQANAFINRSEEYGDGNQLAIGNLSTILGFGDYGDPEEGKQQLTNYSSLFNNSNIHDQENLGLKSLLLTYLTSENGQNLSDKEALEQLNSIMSGTNEEKGSFIWDAVNYSKAMSQDDRKAYSQFFEGGSLAYWQYETGQYEDIAEVEGKIKAKKENIKTSKDNIKTEEEKIKQEKLKQEPIYLDMIRNQENPLYGIDSDQFDKSVLAMKDMADAGEGLLENLKDNEIQISKITQANMRLETGAKNLYDNWDKWNEVISEGNVLSSEYRAAMDELKTSVANILDIDLKDIDDDFVVKHYDLIAEAAKGSSEAINKLKVEMSKDIAIEASLDYSKVEDGQQGLEDLMAKVASEDLEIGATLDDSEFASALFKMLEMAGASVEDMQRIFNTLGWEPEVGSVKATGTVTADADGYVDLNGEKVYVGVGQRFTEGMEIPYIKTNGKGTPSFNFRGTTDLLAPKPKNNGGGGGSKKPAEKKKKTDIVDRYKEITDSLDDNTDAMEKASRAAERLYGKDRLSNMREANKLLQNEIELTKKKRKEAEAYLKEDGDALATAAAEVGIEFTFDDKGNITNYTEQMTLLYDQLDAAITKANEDGSASETEQEEIDNIQKKIDNVKDALSTYEETRETIEDLDKELEEKFNEWQDNNFEILNAELEIKIELNDMELEKIEYYLSKIEDDFYSMAEAASLMAFNENGSLGGQMGVYLDNLEAQKEYIKDLENSFAAEEISETAFVEGLKNANSAIYENLGNIQALDKEMQEYYSDTLEAASEELSKYTELMEHSAAVLDHYKSIAEMLGKSTDYKYMDKILRGQSEVAKQSYEISKANYEMLKRQEADRKADYDAAVARGAGEKELEGLKKNWEAAQKSANEAQEQMLSDAEAWGEALRAVLDNELSRLGQDLENSLTGAFGSFDAMDAAFERRNSLQEEYLTTTNKIYETNKLMRTAQQEIDKTTNQMAKTKLKQFINETSALQQQGRLSQYELDIQQAKYDLLLAEIALREAQNAKSTVRLRRDSEGNFGYVYTADQNAIADAQQKFEDAENALYNKALEGANNYVQKYQETMAEMQDTLTQMHQDYLDGAYESEEEYNRAVEEAKAYYYQKLTDYSELYQVAVDADAQAANEAWSKGFADITKNTEYYMGEVSKYIGGAKGAIDEWKDAMDTINQETLGNMEQAVQDVVKASQDLAKTAKEEVIPELESELTAVGNVTTAYMAYRDSLDQVIGKYETLVEDSQTLIVKLSEMETQAKKTATAINTAYTASPSSNTGGTGGTGGDYVGSYISQTTPEKTMHQSGTYSGNVRTTLSSKDAKTLNGVYYTRVQINGTDYWVKNTDMTKGQFLGGGPSGATYKVTNIPKFQYYDTGGYTGEWGPYGKMAMLHEKELILNKHDTENFLASMEILHRILEIIDLQSMSSQIGGILSSPAFNGMNNSAIEQNVHIEASFPNATNHSEIEEAFNNLINTASQYANRK